MKIILKPLEIENTVDIEPLAKLLSEKGGVWILYGKAKVGKTALMYKLMHWWFLQGDNAPPIFIPLGGIKSYHYWDLQICKLYIDEKIFQLFEKMIRIIPKIVKGGDDNKPIRIILLTLLSIRMNVNTSKTDPLPPAQCDPLKKKFKTGLIDALKNGKELVAFAFQT